MDAAQDGIVEMLWKACEAKIVPPHVSPAMRVEMRIFFFSGAAMLFSTVNGVLESPVTQDGANKFMNSVGNELTEFAQELAAKLPQQHTGPMQ